jgi:hypothetical protein
MVGNNRIKYIKAIVELRDLSYKMKPFYPDNKINAERYSF